MLSVMLDPCPRVSGSAYTTAVPSGSTGRSRSIVRSTTSLKDPLPFCATMIAPGDSSVVEGSTKFTGVPFGKSRYWSRRTRSCRGSVWESTIAACWLSMTSPSSIIRAT